MSFGAPFPGSRVLNVSLLDSQVQAGVGSTKTFSSLSFGPEYGDRYLVACLSWVGTSASLSSVTIGGVSATINVTQLSGAGSRYTAICTALVPTGASGSVVANMASTNANATVALYALTGHLTGSPASTDSSAADAPTANLNIGAGGYGLGVAATLSTSSPSASWSGLTEDVETQFGTQQTRSVASQRFDTAQPGLAATCTFSSVTANNSSGCFAVFNP